MKRAKVKIADLIREGGRWYGGERPKVYRYDTGWIKREDWSKQHLGPQTPACWVTFTTTGGQS